MLVAGHIKHAEYDKFKEQADVAIKQANKVPLLNASPTEEQSEIPKSIPSSNYVRINYVSRKMIAYYANTHLIAIEHLDFSKTMIKREIYDVQGRLRVQLLFNAPDTVRQEDYFDEKGRRVDQYRYIAPTTGGDIYVH
jgi:hypothetical protein